VGHGDAVAERPQVAEPAAGEFDAGGEQLFRVAWQALVVFAVVQQFLGRHVAVEHAEQVLRRHAMAGFVVEDRQDLRPAGDESADDHHFGHGVVRAAGMARQPFRPRQGREKHDRVAGDLDVVLQGGGLFVGERGHLRVKLERLQGFEIDRKSFGGHRVGEYRGNTGVMQAERFRPGPELPVFAPIRHARRV